MSLDTSSWKDQKEEEILNFEKKIVVSRYEVH